METVGRFQAGDYVVFACLFVVSSGIGVFFAIKERNKAPSKEFLVGGRQMSCGPVALSLTASFMSAVTVIGAPADVYRFGASYVIFGVAYTFVVFFTAELFLPVFYRSGITSTYEYLELRFCKLVRVAATLIYIIQTILYTGVVVYAPALALNQVTGFDLWGSIFATGIVCTFYCTLGGLKAVVWTDAFQMVVMVVGFLTVLIQGSSRAGGIENVWSTSRTGGRLQVFDFDVSPLRRHTFWTLSVGGTFTWLGIYGVNQSTIQRCISCKTEGHARWALYLNLLGLWIILFCAVVSGLIMYSYYSHCDPWSSGLISAPDQLMPYFVMEILGAFPGLPGLFVACAFSGTLSTVAASINALATVMYEDFVSQCFPDLSNRAASWISKALCVAFGVACTTMAVAASYMGGIVQAALSIHGMCGGPVLGLFSLGILFPFTNLKGAVGGLIVGISLSFWVGVGAFIYPAPSNNTHALELNTAGCNITAAAFEPTSATVTQLTSDRNWLADSWYSMSYLYYSAVGFIGTVAAGLLITLLTGPMDPKLLKPGMTRSVKEVMCFCTEKFTEADLGEGKEDVGDFGKAWEKHPDQGCTLRMDEKFRCSCDNQQENGNTNAGFDHNETSIVQKKL
ncbi:sodium-coupled monocarboxylate transporter 2 [Danio rerio]|uniref:Sodium-coupled monocarboxylate transporter 2 n=1 Tax=Danio rerio TaxID=7955 RepID=SC5AC_DANRE|nr:sodium-coupled monocarboxylate transporter 2 [Danio rerio]Q7T384.1 RecName: Full=Sodium-coupled monocarboxylate transporter 2; AltName: Full=Electroneutral sodium monocarboxylate cotransporter; Short=zSMCTn; AltName: Full=Low-affinity sodium-lactate cotransporter; AltName: Full=Solute carrier family 5 member 12; Short=zSLC5A12 [Danio rerio]AAH53215.1 Solute carrier family 5 (sodium/glucose cotransporter), member 12 [Danio rerio]AAW55812.1 electroneutral sodium monocarboxylate cotransporter [D|eukprot:NP_956662.1 sodium-coupled monocarboxylate transporter 2 [Danio rerio]